MAVAKGKAAFILYTRGDLDEALNIYQHDELPVYERLGEKRSKAVTLFNIALVRLAQDDATSRDDASRLLSEAYETLAPMAVPEAQAVLDIAARHDLELDTSAFTSTPESSPG